MAARAHTALKCSQMLPTVLSPLPTPQSAAAQRGEDNETKRALSYVVEESADNVDVVLVIAGGVVQTVLAALHTART